MPLVECPDCQKRVSDRAPTCPNCGYPIAGIGSLGPQPEPKKHKTGCGVVLLLAVGLFVALMMSISSDSEKEAKNPTCKSDWHRCVDNADMVNNFKDWFSVRYDCERAAVKLAKYNEPKFVSHSFGRFYTGDNYVKTGIVTAIEPDAKFSNAFGAMVSSTVNCKYDLNRKLVIDASIKAN